MNILSHGQEYFPAFNIEGKVLISLNDFDFLFENRGVFQDF